MPTETTTDLLVYHQQAIPTLRQWFEAEWPAWYGPGGPGSALADLNDYANEGSLPVGIVALQNGRVCGVAVLKAASLPSHARLSPWAGGGFVDPALRGRGIGALMLSALELQARRLGFDTIYCGTATSQSLLERCGWELLENIQHDGKILGVYSKRV